MEIQKAAVAGTLESSDAQVTVEPGTGGIHLELSSSVMNQYGRQIKATVLETLERLAGEWEIPVQRDIMRGGGTDAGAIHTTRMGVLTGGVSVPCRYIHTPTEMADLGDAEACVKLLAAFAQEELTRL